MDHHKLFHVLVIGGALLGTACGGSAPAPDAARGGEDSGPAPDDAGGAETDAQASTDAGGAETDAPLTECGFCPNDACCEPDGMGGSRTRAGMMCCWSTSC